MRLAAVEPRVGETVLVAGRDAHAFSVEGQAGFALLVADESLAGELDQLFDVAALRVGVRVAEVAHARARRQADHRPGQRDIAAVGDGDDANRLDRDRGGLGAALVGTDDCLGPDRGGPIVQAIRCLERWDTFERNCFRFRSDGPGFRCCAARRREGILDPQHGQGREDPERQQGEDDTGHV